MGINGYCGNDVNGTHAGQSCSRMQSYPELKKSTDMRRWRPMFRVQYGGLRLIRRGPVTRPNGGLGGAHKTPWCGGTFRSESRL